MKYYEGSWKKLPDFARLTPIKTGIVKQANLAETNHRPDEFALVLEGYVDIATTGVQTFYLNSDDGSKLYIDNELVVDHDGDHSAIKKTGQIILASGPYIKYGLNTRKLGARNFCKPACLMLRGWQYPLHLFN